VTEEEFNQLKDQNEEFDIFPILKKCNSKPE